MTLVDVEAPQQVPRDRWGRPLCLPADAFDDDGYVKPGKPPKRKGLQRVTTLAKAAEDASSLTNWACRMTLIGAASRPDIIASTQAADPDDRKALDALVEKAKELGGANVRRELGTAVHKFFELKAADPTYVVPEPYAADVDAILAAIDRAGFDIVTEHSEQLVVIYTIGCAGTPDLILRERSTGDYYIGDLKTGASVQYGSLGWATQLSAYSIADAFYCHGDEADGSEDRLLPMPPVSRDRGVIIHCQPGSGTADLYWLTLGQNLVDLAVAVREVRKRRDLLVPFEFEGGGTTATTDVSPSASAAVVGTVDDPTDAAALVGPLELPFIVHEARTAWLINKATRLVERLSKRHVAEAWPTDVSPPLYIKEGQDQWSVADINAAAKALDALEAKHDVPFGDEDPLVTARRRAEVEAKIAAEVTPPAPEPEPTPEPDGPKADPDAVDTVMGIVKTMAKSDNPEDRERIGRVQAWQRQASSKNVGWKIGGYKRGEVPERLYAIVAAAVGCLDLIDLDATDPDRRVRDLLAAVLDDDIAQQPTASVGALFGLLTTDQALRLADMADTATNTNNTDKDNQQ